MIPCTKTDFTCGFSPTNCTDKTLLFALTAADQVVLTAPQLTKAMKDAGIPTDSDLTVTATPTSTVGVVTITATAKPLDPAIQYTSGQMIGVGAGVGIPLLAAIGVLTFFLVAEKKRHQVTEISESAYRPPRPPPPGTANSLTRPDTYTNSWSAWSHSTKEKSPTDFTSNAGTPGLDIRPRAGSRDEIGVVNPDPANLNRF
jgi:hypothetical protein